jgi:gliding motility-associated-like protein
MSIQPIKALVFIIFVLIASQTKVFSQLIVTPGVPAANLAGSAFGNGITVSGIPEINCNSAQYGSFTNGLTTVLGFNSGLVMSTGSAAAAAGPSGQNASTSYGISYTDPELTVISPGATRDACIITINIVPQCNSLALRFVFGSEEYPEFVGGNFNDVFGFFVSGPTPSGGSYTNLNVAQLPNGTPVSINNVNATSNPEFYVNNSNNGYIKYDGLTTVLLPVIDVIPCEVYTFKLAIADAGDFIYDSAIFIDFISCSNSVAATNPVITPATCNDSTGSIELEITNGVGPFVVNWEEFPDSTSTSLHNVPPGVYTFQVLDQGIPCATTSVFDFEVPTNGSMPITNIATSDSVICIGQSVVLNATGADDYVWVSSQGVSTDSIFTAALTASEWIHLQGTNMCGMVEDSMFVQVNDIPVMNPTALEDTLCAGQMIIFQSNIPQTGTISWFGPGGFNSASFNPSIPNATVNHSGTFFANVSVNGCSSGPQPITILVKPTPSVGGAAVPIICQGQSIQLFAQPNGNQFSWTGPNGFSANTQQVTIPDAMPNMSGIYSLQIGQNGCFSNTQNFNVSVTASPQVGLNPSYAACLGSSITIDAVQVSGASYAWTGPNGFSASGPSITLNGVTNVNAGTYGVTATLSGCPSSNITTEFVVINNPIASPSTLENTVCEGEIISLLGQSNMPDVQYFWSGPNGFVSNDQSPVIPNAIENNEGIYNLYVNFMGCVSPTASVNMMVNPVPDATVWSNSPVCENGTISLFSSSSTFGTYSWQGPMGFTSSQAEPIINNAALANGGNYTLQVVAAGCVSVPDTVTVNITPLPVVSPSNNGPLCVGDNLQLTANFTNATSYEWTGPNGYAAAIQNPTILGVNTGDAGTYSLVVVANGCASVASTTTLEVNANPIVTAASEGWICNGQSIDLISTGLTNAVWSPGALNGTTVSVSPNVTQTFTVVGTDANGCSGMATTDVEVYSPFVNVSSVLPNALNSNDSTQGYLPLDVTFEWSTNAETAVWNMGDSSDWIMVLPNDPNVQYMYVDEGVFPAVLMVTLNGCPAMDTVWVTTFGVSMVGCELELGNCNDGFIPNIVTPNSDGENDYFWVPNMHMATLDVRIFNRWGEEVGAITQPNKYLWTADYYWDPKDLGNGVYYFVVNGVGKDGVKHAKEGFFEVVK